jgi:hypothetical protein
VSGGRRLETALQDQEAAVEHFADRAGAIPADDWTVPRAPGAWSPAEITEHLVLAFDVVAGEIEGGAGIRVRLGPVLRLLTRWTVLPRILAGRAFPAGVKAVREARPQGASHSRDESLDRLRRAASRFEAAARAAPERTRITHPFFGRLPLARAVRFSAAHVRHHAAQLPRDAE